MPEIQEQVEQTMADLKLTVGRVGVEGISKYYALLRRFVEECCKSICVGCANGAGLDTHEGEFIHVEQRENDDIDTFPCEANKTRRQFAWLEGE